MVLKHVPQNARFVVVVSAASDGDFFGDRDLDVIDVVPVPKGFEDGIPETKYQNVLDGFFAEVMIDAVDLIFTERLMDRCIECLGAGEIGAERFFNNHPSMAVGVNI